MKKQPLIILTGPTAVGKTKASIGLAKAIGGEIISADSMQVYDTLRIVTARLEAFDGVNGNKISDLFNSFMPPLKRSSNKNREINQAFWRFHRYKRSYV